MTLIEVRRLWKRYARKVVLEDIRLAVRRGEFVTIVGASGCGKTTFLRLLLGEIAPSDGSIELAGEPLAAEPDANRGVVFQRYSVFPHLTALGNVLLGLELRDSSFLGRTFGAKRKRNVERARQMLDRVGLLASANAYAAELSGGMQQRQQSHLDLQALGA